ncbi:MAG TPA: YihY/virulence factor BrkB family protein [Acidobacteriaceae bacterium]|jgi:membrane protein|nr:YihY/virulence factor BrkB family protein [Acidobacteriaceae bacterium]
MPLKSLFPGPHAAARSLAPPAPPQAALPAARTRGFPSRWNALRRLPKIVARELIRTRALDVAAGVAFWSMLSMIPLLMVVIALISLLPIPSLIPQLLGVLAILVPPQSLSMVENLAGTLLVAHRGILSFGLLSYIWSTTSGFTSLIAALNIAYDVTTERSLVRDRLQALLLTFTSGGLVTVSLLALIAGPHFAHFLGQIVPVPAVLEKLWPIIRVATVFSCFVMALELIYFLGPNMRQRFAATLPGALFSIALWFSGSFALSFYLDHMANYSRLYGGMGALIGLMLWIYLIALAVLIGAEANAELAKLRHPALATSEKDGPHKGIVPPPEPDRFAA